MEVNYIDILFSNMQGGKMALTLELIVRIMIAGILGIAIGFERQYRAKDAGIRTHFLVAIGSALFMIISQWGFETSTGVPGIRGADSSRVAAQIVSGIGFIGAGTIMMQKQFVRGLTTAAGLWVAAAIGMACGGGLYTISIVTTVLTLICLELFQIFFIRIKTQATQLVYSSLDYADLQRVTDAINREGDQIMSCSISQINDGTAPRYRFKITLREHVSHDESHWVSFMQQFPSVMVEKIE